MIEIEQYTDLNGRNWFERWYDRLEDVTASRVDLALDRLKRGSRAVKGVGAGVMELRLDLGPGYRVYFARDGHLLIILLCGGDKKRQHNDIATAQTLWQEYKRRKKER